jgi:hypothetical protein
MPKPPSPAPAPAPSDFSMADVRTGFKGLAPSGTGDTQPWANAINTAAHQSGSPTFKQFAGSDADPLAPVQSMWQSQISDDNSVLGGLKSIGSLALTALGHPITAATDETMVALIREAQKDFLNDNDSTLRALSNDVGSAKAAMRQLADLLAKSGFSPTKLDTIMRKKQAAGGWELMQLQNAIDNAKTPEERTQLQATKADFDKWLTSADQRTAAEQPAVTALQNKMNQINRTIIDQASSMTDAATSRGPGNVTGADKPEDPSRVLSTTHSQPDAILHVASLHNFLLQSRAQLGGVLQSP